MTLLKQNRYFVPLILLLGSLLCCVITSDTSTTPLSGAALFLKNKVINLVNNHLRANDLQTAFDKTPMNDIVFDGQQTIQQLTTKLETFFEKIFTSVKNIQRVLEDLHTTDGFDSGDVDECCKLDERDLEYNLELKSNVTNKLCFRRANNSAGTIPTSSLLLNEMQTNTDLLPSLKWQYYGTEEGLFTIYQASKLEDCNKYDPRFRPWYVEVATPTPKDLVLVFDRSKSMENDQKFEIAKKALEIVINTLSPNDRVTLVAFSDIAFTPTGTDSEACYKKEMAYATPEVKQYLINYLKTKVDLDGNTDYIIALEKAFELLATVSDVNGHSQEKRKKSILFLTDDSPSVGSNNRVRERLSELNAAQQNKVLVLTFGLGNQISEEGVKLLKDMANMTAFDASAGQRLVGQFELINDTQYLRAELGSYYNHFTEVEKILDPVISVPYIDYSGLGHIFSTCLPVKIDGTLRGVTCVDMRLEDIKNEYDFFESEDTYVFIIDDTGRTLIHPMIPAPGLDANSDPIFVNIKVFEPLEVVNEILSKDSGEKTIEKKIVISRGNAKFDGINQESKTSHYFWEKLNGTRYTLCVVRIPTNRPNAVEFTENKAMKSFSYHLLDKSYTQNSVNFCQNNGHNVTKDFITIQLSKDNRRDKNYIDQITGKFESKDSFDRTDLRNSLALLESVVAGNSSWKSSYKPYIEQLYTGTYDGGFMVYPGRQLPRDYDHRKTVWYQAAKAQPDKYMFLPSLNGGLSGVKAITRAREGVHSSSDFVWAVMGVDFESNLVNSIVENSVETCSSRQNRCLLLDNNGYLLYHPDVLNDGPTFPIPIASVEPDITAVLIRENILIANKCTDFAWKEKYHTWKMEANRIPQQKRMSSNLETEKYFITPIEDTNLFFLVISNEFEESQSCTACPTNLEFLMQDEFQTQLECVQNEKCHCPCYSSANYQHCKNEFEIPEGSSPDTPCLKANDENQIQFIANIVDSSSANLRECNIYNCADFGHRNECILYKDCHWFGEGAGSCKELQDDRTVSLLTTAATNASDLTVADPTSTGVNKAAIAVPVIVAIVVILAVMVFVILYKKGINPLEMLYKPSPILKREGIYSDIGTTGDFVRNGDISPYHISLNGVLNNPSYGQENRQSDVIPGAFSNPAMTSQSSTSSLSSPEVRFIATDRDDLRPVLIIPVKTGSSRTPSDNSEISYVAMNNNGHLGNMKINGLHSPVTAAVRSAIQNEETAARANSMDRELQYWHMQRQNEAFDKYSVEPDIGSETGTNNYYEPVENPTLYNASNQIQTQPVNQDKLYHLQHNHRLPEENSFRSSVASPIPSTASMSNLNLNFPKQDNENHGQNLFSYQDQNNISYEHPIPVPVERSPDKQGNEVQLDPNRLQFVQNDEGISTSNQQPNTSQLQPTHNEIPNHSYIRGIASDTVVKLPPSPHIRARHSPDIPNSYLTTTTSTSTPHSSFTSIPSNYV